MKKLKYIAKSIPVILYLCSSVGYANEFNLKFLNEYSIPTDKKFEGVSFGGLSGIAWDSKRNVYYSISDSRNTKSEGLSRYYTLDIKLSEKGIEDIDILKMTEMVNSDGTSFKVQTVDGEGIAIAPNGESLFWVSELGASLINSSFDGKLIKDYTAKIPQYYNAGGDLKNSNFGLHSGMSFEGISITPSKKFLYVAAESALKQDSKFSTTLSSSPSRILKYRMDDRGGVGELIGEFIYNIDPIPQVSPHGLSDNGVSEVLAYSDDKLLIIERSGRNASVGFSEFDFKIKVYAVDLTKATNILGKDTIKKIEKINLFQTASKKLLIDFSDYTNAPDCIEGVTFGPLINGMKSLIFVSDNNFQPYQSNKFFVFTDENNLLK